MRTDPYLAFRYQLTIGGVPVGGFSEVSGLQIEIEVEDYREGGRNDYVHRLPGPAKYPQNLVLKWGLTDDDFLWWWHELAVAGQIVRLSGAIFMVNGDGLAPWHWDFIDAYPVRWIGPPLRAGSAELAIETLELVHNGLKRR